MIGFWFLVMILTGIALISILAILGNIIKNKNLLGGLATLTSILIIAGGIYAGNWWLNNTASGLRTQVTWRAEMQLGLDRTIQVFTATGELVYEYSGRFDVDQNAERIIIDIIDEELNSRRVYVSAPAGVIIISEY